METTTYESPDLLDPIQQAVDIVNAGIDVDEDVLDEITATPRREAMKTSGAGTAYMGEMGNVSVMDETHEEVQEETRIGPSTGSHVSKYMHGNLNETNESVDDLESVIGFRKGVVQYKFGPFDVFVVFREHFRPQGSSGDLWRYRGVHCLPFSSERKS